jgi:hypothetical protein
MTIQGCLFQFGDHRIFAEMFDGKSEQRVLTEGMHSMYELIVSENEK